MTMQAEVAPITVNVDLPTDNTDVLAGTLLDPVPGSGSLLVWIASSQRDGTVIITGPGVSGGTFLIPPVLRTNGIPDLEQDMPNIVPVAGGKVFINYDEVTAGDAWATVMFIGG